MKKTKLTLTEYVCYIQEFDTIVILRFYDSKWGSEEVAIYEWEPSQLYRAQIKSGYHDPTEECDPIILGIL